MTTPTDPRKISGGMAGPELTCHCGDAMRKTSLDLSNPQPDGTILIDMEMASVQEEFDCSKCGCTTYTGDLNTETEPDECPDDDEDDSEED